MLLHHTWPSMLSTCGSHGAAAAALSALSFVTATDGASVSTLYVLGIPGCALSVYCHKISIQQQKHSRSSTTAAVLQARASAPVATVYVCVWLVQSRRSSHDIELRRPMQQSSTHRRTAYQVYEAYSSSKSSTW